MSGTIETGNLFANTAISIGTSDRLGEFRVKSSGNENAFTIVNGRVGVNKVSSSEKLEVNGGIGLDLDITSVNIYSLYKRFYYFSKWISIRIIRGYSNLSYINHQRFLPMYFQYGFLILYHYILHLRLVKG